MSGTKSKLPRASIIIRMNIEDIQKLQELATRAGVSTANTLASIILTSHVHNQDDEEIY